MMTLRLWTYSLLAAGLWIASLLRLTDGFVDGWELALPLLAASATFYAGLAFDERERIRSLRRRFAELREVRSESETIRTLRKITDR